MIAARKHTPWLLGVLGVIVLGATLLVDRSGTGSKEVVAAAETTTTTAPATTTTTTSTTTTVAPTTEPPATDPAPPADNAPAANARAANPPAPAPPATDPPAPEPPPEPPAPAPSGSFDTAAAGQIIGYMNGVRANEGAGPLSADGCLTGLAQGWAQTMGDSGSMSHNPGFASCSGTAAENIGKWRPCNTGAMDAFWDGSAGHHNNMVNPAYGSVGVGVYRDGGGGCWYVVDFGP